MENDETSREPPRRGSALSRSIATLALRLAGWRIEGELPQSRLVELARSLSSR